MIYPTIQYQYSAITKFTVALCFLLLATTSCTRNKVFDKEVWLSNSNVNDTHNLRAYMIKDLMENHLKVGLTRNAVLDLLGKPYKAVIENRLPKGVEVPDSLSLKNDRNLTSEVQEKVIVRINEFQRLNAKPDTLMLYPVGWSTIDLNFLAVQFDNKGRVRDFWIEQH